MEDKVKPCPFCGSQPEAQCHAYSLGEPKYSFQCVKGHCPMEGVYTYKESSKKEAIKAWNTRA
ncbi:MAG: hypothetical protein DRJ03_02445 [Chloroflexi bacterium]|nr:MAG: hypothetical protein DRJ03_02445 [Chloroflexota bacterium]